MTLLITASTDFFSSSRKLANRLLEMGIPVVLATDCPERDRLGINGLDTIYAPSWSLPRAHRFAHFARMLLRMMRRPATAVRLARNLSSDEGTWKARLRRAYELLPFVGVTASAARIEGTALVPSARLRTVLKCPIVTGSTIRPGIDTDLYGPPQGATSAHPEVLRVIAKGGLGWQRGLEYLLAAVRRLVDQGMKIRVEIIDDGSTLRDRQRLLYTLRDMSLTDAVSVITCGPDEAAARLRHADVFVDPSVTAPHAHIVLQAMSCGLPVVATALSGRDMCVTDHVEAILVPIRQPEAIAQRLRQLATNVHLRQCMGMAGRARVLRDFTIERQAAELGAMYFEATR